LDSKFPVKLNQVLKSFIVLLLLLSAQFIFCIFLQWIS